jgi:hypothetical protein
MNKINEERLTQITHNLKKLDQHAALKARLIRDGRMKDGKPYMSLFEFGESHEYFPSMELTESDTELLESICQELYDITPDSEFLDVQRVEHEDGMLATAATMDYDALRFINKQGIRVMVDFSPSISDDDLAEGPMTDLYYELDSLIVQGV